MKTNLPKIFFLGLGIAVFVLLLWRGGSFLDSRYQEKPVEKASEFAVSYGNGAGKGNIVALGEKYLVVFDESTGQERKFLRSSKVLGAQALNVGDSVFFSFSGENLTDFEKGTSVQTPVMAKVEVGYLSRNYKYIAFLSAGEAKDYVYSEKTAFVKGGKPASLNDIKSGDQGELTVSGTMILSLVID